MFETVLIIASLSILVFIHELGHFLAARIFGIRVEKFYIFFDFLFPVPSLLKFSLLKWKKGDTEYGIGWFPLGGYVQISGMIDEQMDEKALATPPQPWEFRSKPAWQKLIVMIGGIVMNVILGVFIFSCLKLVAGESGIDYSKAEYGLRVYPNSLEAKLGLQPGDQMISFDGNPVRYNSDIPLPALLGGGKTFTVLRNGQEMQLTVPDSFSDYVGAFSQLTTMFMPETTLDSIIVDSSGAAYHAGLRSGDKISFVDTVAVNRLSSVQQYLQFQPNRTVSVVFERSGIIDTVVVITDAEGRMGFTTGIGKFMYHRDIGFGAAIASGTAAAFSVVRDNAIGLWLVIRGKIDASKSLSGPVGIAKVLGQSTRAEGWFGFWKITGMLSMVLAFVNFLPIPALDGGHIVFSLIEMITGKQPSTKVLMIAQYVGMVLILLLMFFTFYFDLTK